MIKTKFLLITIVMSVLLIGCVNILRTRGEKNEQNQVTENTTLYPSIIDNTDKNTFTTLSDEDFILKNKDSFIELGGNYENLITNDEITHISYLDENRVYDTYVYENFIVSVSPAKNTVFFINLVSPELKTSRGISIGDSIADVLEKYGLVDGDSYMYHYNNKILTFYADENGKITNIKLELI